MKKINKVCWCFACAFAAGVLALAMLVGPVSAEESILSLRNAKFKLGGELELEIVDSQSNDVRNNPRTMNESAGAKKDSNNPHPRMAIDKIVITPEVSIGSDIHFKADIEFNPDKPVKLDEAWVKFSGLPGNSWVTVGLEDPFIHASRKTESYPMLGHAFWQDEDLGFFAGGEGEMFYWRLSATNGRRLADRQSGEDKTYFLTHDDDDNNEGNANKQLGIGLGLKHSFKEGHEIDLMPFFYQSDLSTKDIAYLSTIAGYAGGTDKDQSRQGVSLDYQLRGLNFFAQFMQATDGGMDRDGWYVQPSFKQKMGMDRLRSLEVVLRYEEYNVDLSNVTTDSRTWDRQTTTLSIISEIVKGFKIKTEYYLNDEDTGGADVDNNEFLMQAEVKF